MSKENNNLGAKTEFFSPVIIKPVSLLIPDMDTCSYNNHAVVVTTPEGNEKIVNFCSEGYGLLPNSAIFPKIEKKLKQHFKFKANYQTRDNGRFCVDYVLEGNALSVGKKNDTMKPVLRVQHSYNSQTTFRIQFGFYREICSNGMWGMQFEEATEFSHTIEQVKFIVEGTLEATNNFIKEGSKAIDGFNQLGDRKIKDYQGRIEEVIEATKFYQIEEEIVKRVLFEHKNNKLPITDWLIYNGFNFQLNHNEKVQAQQEHLMKLDQKVYKYLINNENKLLK